MPDPLNISIREATDKDAPGLITLIGDIFKEYDCVLDLEDLDKELLGIKTAMKAQYGKFWVAEHERRIVGCIGYGLKGESRNIVELKRLYVGKDFRRQGLAVRLANLVYQAAGAVGAKAIDLWSDTRFKEAHAFYLQHGFVKLPETRRLYDPSNSTEFHFIKSLRSLDSGS